MLPTNKIYAEFDSLVDKNSLLKLKTQVDTAIIKNWSYARPTKYSSQINFHTQELPGLIDLINEARRYPEKFGEEKFIRQLDNEDLLGSFLRYQVDVKYSSLSMNLRYAKDYLKKDDPTFCHSTDIDKNFNFFYEWLEKQNLFSKFGRVVIFLNEPGTITLEHRDLPDNSFGVDEFVWINLDNRKKFYVKDNSTKIKTYIKSSIAWFNTKNYHGADPTEFACYSIRVDGKFSDRVRDYLSI